MYVTRKSFVCTHTSNEMKVSCFGIVNFDDLGQPHVRSVTIVLYYAILALPSPIAHRNRSSWGTVSEAMALWAKQQRTYVVLQRRQESGSSALFTWVISHHDPPIP